MRKFSPIDLSQVSTTARDVLDVTLPELLDLWHQAKPGKRPELREYRLKKWRVQFAGVPAWEITPDHVGSMAAAMQAQGYAGSSINRDVADISSCYGWAIKRRHAPAEYQNPCREFERLADNVRRVELTEVQRKGLLAAAKCSRWDKLYALVLLALHSGARRSEMANLRWGDVSLAEKRAVLHDTKAGTPRRLLLTDDVVRALKAIRPTPCPDDAFVFHGRSLFKRHDFRKCWEKCRRDAGLPHLHLHDLRHAAAARMLKRGGTVHEVSQVLGHKSPQMLQRVYGHLDDSHLADVVAGAWS
jgi:integrase